MRNAMKRSRKVQGKGGAYRAFAIDTSAGESSALMEMENNLARLELDHGGYSDEDINEVEEVVELEDEYEDCGIGSYEIFVLNPLPLSRYVALPLNGH